MSDTVIKVENLSKKYVIGHQQKQQGLRHALNDGLTNIGRRFIKPSLNGKSKLTNEEFWALKDVSFEVKQGDVVGIIGRNGAGKSTLLKILSRITEPTTGRISLKGRVASLLEVGTGFHPELTGRENIYLNGAILGMSRDEIRRKFDEIVDFAEIEKFLDTPVKRYSSGMYVRLAFAVAAHLEPEILVVDEVLAVGDAEFQKKCLGKMNDVSKKDGRTVLFVSHQMAAISNLCNRGILLSDGNLVLVDDVKSTIAKYSSAFLENIKNNVSMSRCRPSWAKPIITSLRILDKLGNESSNFPLGSDITFELSFKTINDAIKVPVMGVVINHLVYGPVGVANNRISGFVPSDGSFEEGTIRCILNNVTLTQGDYSIDFWLGDRITDIDNVTGYLKLHIYESDVFGSGYIPFSNSGPVYFAPEWQLTSKAYQPI